MISVARPPRAYQLNICMAIIEKTYNPRSVTLKHIDASGITEAEMN
jgi:hypothetical protein